MSVHSPTVAEELAAGAREEREVAGTSGVRSADKSRGAGKTPRKSTTRVKVCFKDSSIAEHWVSPIFVFSLVSAYI